MEPKPLIYAKAILCEQIIPLLRKSLQAKVPCNVFCFNFVLHSNFLSTKYLYILALCTCTWTPVFAWVPLYRMMDLTFSPATFAESEVKAVEALEILHQTMLFGIIYPSVLS